MAKRYSRAGTTVNINVPRGAAARRRAATRRAAPRKTTTTTRTLSQVYRGPQKSDNTALYVGGAALALGAAFLLWPSTASAATPGAPGGQGGQGGAGGAAIPNMPPVPPNTPAQTVPTNPAFPPIPGASGGYSGPGNYRVTAPSGLRVRAQTTSASTDLGVYPIGTPVEVVADAGNGWFQVSSPVPGYMCASCAQAPGGPWLVRQS